MIFQESMVIPSLYTREDQMLIERWMRSVPAYPERDDLADANRVAEIALHSVQCRLPQGLSIKEDGSATLGRKTWQNPVGLRNKLVFPIHLLEVDRDDSQLDIKCPEACYATLLPGYNVYVITISQDSAESYGYYDVAISCFQAVDEKNSIAADASLILKEWWQFQHKELRKPHWNRLLKQGLIDAGSALRLRNEVWSAVENADGILS